MTKFGQAEYSDFMAKVFADKLDKILEQDEKQSFNSKNFSIKRRRYLPVSPFLSYE